MTTQPKVKFEEDGNGGGQQQQPRQAGPNGGNRSGKKQKANQQGQAGGRPPYRSPIEEIKDQIFSVGSTTFKRTNDAIADYAQIHLHASPEVAGALRTGTPVVTAQPARPTATGADNKIDEFDLMEWKLEYNAFMKKKDRNEQALQSLFPLLLGQCDDYLRGRIKNRSDFQQLLSSSDTIGLRRAIEEEGYSVNNHEFPYVNALRCRNRIARLRSDKGGGQSTGEHLDALDAACDLLDRSAGTAAVGVDIPQELEVLAPCERGLAAFVIKSNHPPMPSPSMWPCPATNSCARSPPTSATP